MLSDSEMKSLIERIHEQLNFIYSKADYGEGVDRSILYPPPTSSELAALKVSAFPPSYRRFLEWHNGWEHFWSDVTLTGVSGKHTKAVQDKFSETVAWQAAEEELGQLSEDKISEWEGQAEENMYLARHVCLGTNFAGDFYVFDKGSVRPDGEMRIVYWTISGGAYEDPYEDFTALLRRVAAEVEEEAKKYAKKGTRTKKK